LVKTLAVASATASETKFSLAISSSWEWLALHLVLDGLIDFGIDFGQGPRHSFRYRHS